MARSISVMRIFWRSSGMVKTALSFCMIGPLAAVGQWRQSGLNVEHVRLRMKGKRLMVPKVLQVLMDRLEPGPASPAGSKTRLRAWLAGLVSKPVNRGLKEHYVVGSRGARGFILFFFGFFGGGMTSVVPPLAVI